MKLLAIVTISALSATTYADTFIVTANSSSWSPSVANVVPGDIIRFEYGTGYPHTITSGSACTPDGVWFDESLSAPGDFYEFTVPNDGTTEIPFFCAPHCAVGMDGVILIDLPQGHMVIGIVDIANPYSMNYSVDDLSDTATMSIDCDGTLGSSFAVGVEVEELDVDVDINVFEGGASAYMLQVSTGVDTLLTNGTYTLNATERYLFHGDTVGTQYLNFALTWPETGFEDSVNFSSIHLGGVGSVNSSGDSFAMYVPNSTSGGGTISIEATSAGEMFLGLIGNVTCSTLVLPASGEEGKVAVPAGTHVINITGLGMLWLPESGGSGSGMAEDVDGDGVVGVSDLLAVIAAWGSTSP